MNPFFTPEQKKFTDEAIKIIDEELVLMGIKLSHPEKLSDGLIRIGQLYEKYHDIEHINF